MLRPTSFHVRHDLQPALTYELLNLFLSEPYGQTGEELEQGANLHGFRLRVRKDYSKLIKSLLELELLCEENNKFSLTEKGQIVSRLTLYQRDLLPDFIHFLYCSGFDLDPHKRFSWSYQKVCNLLWGSAPIIINRDRLVNYVTREALTVFSEKGISFSVSSVAGILNWLVELSPTCLITSDSEQKFVRREYCSIELFTLALSHEYSKRKDEQQSYIAIDGNFRENVCRLCLINIESFLEMLSLAEDSFTCIDVRRERGDRISMAKFNWSLLEN